MLSSYPLYITHYPFIYQYWSWLEHGGKNTPDGTKVLLGIAIVILAVLTAYACLKLYDIPLRKWLKGKLFSVKA